jgi:hypothetical protein
MSLLVPQPSRPGEMREVGRGRGRGGLAQRVCRYGQQSMGSRLDDQSRRLMGYRIGPSLPTTKASRPWRAGWSRKTDPFRSPRRPAYQCKSFSQPMALSGTRASFMSCPGVSNKPCPPPTESGCWLERQRAKIRNSARPKAARLGIFSCSAMHA